MRRRLSLLVLAVTSMVVLAFVVPLALLVHDQAETRALNRAQRTAQSVASGLAVATSLTSDLTDETIELVITTAGDDTTSVLLSDGSVFGAPMDQSPASTLAMTGRALTADAEHGVEVLVPVTGPGGTLVVRTFVADDDLRAGAVPATIALSVLGLLLVLAAVAIADRMGRSLVRPVAELAGAARRMGRGDLEARVEPDGPHELADVGEAFNRMAERLDDLIVAERESLADLSHGLRTPLTALRLQAEMLHDRSASEPMLEDLDRLGRQVDGLIAEARRTSPTTGVRHTDLCEVTRSRSEFWSVLAEEQGRRRIEEIPPTPIVVPLGEDALGAAIDNLLENVFSHTEAGVGYRIAVEQPDPNAAVVVVEDDGPGFPPGDVIERGTSGAGSTGLGLDIVRRAAERTGGAVRVTHTTSGGGRVEMTIGLT